MVWPAYQRRSPTFAVVGVVSHSKTWSTYAPVVIYEILTVTERIARKVAAFVQFYVRHA